MKDKGYSIKTKKVKKIPKMGASNLKKVSIKGRTPLDNRIMNGNATMKESAEAAGSKIANKYFKKTKQK